MVKIHLQTILLLLLSLISFQQCQNIPPDASKFVYISANRNESVQRLSTDCAFRYSVVNTYKRIDDESQRDAIRAGFDIWQKACPTIGFLELPARPRLLVQFVDPSEISTQTATVPVGIVQGTATVAAGLRKESSGVYTILLSNAYDWNKNSLTKAIAYHAGLFLGMATSSDKGSLMSPLYDGQPLAISKSDSTTINKLYSNTCKDLTVNYLPFTLQVAGPLTKTVKFDKQGTILVRASGLITVGVFVGITGPEGKDGLFGFPIPQYSIVQEFLHAALMYKLNNESKWHYCGKECNFPTGGAQYVDLTFGVNDLNLTDNTGAYTVVVDYK
ncbi:matrixin family metalloprotease [Spirosoma endophyticum]|uniref:Matrixin n=1 Tax=Spirosoma endophyticum TaxID=662367 RepID=A0A1I2GID6_9BACT|nr:matrixin family metalloprotease [Spirosoma endophyticum]SFF16391.1 Matrixin [Spirosoma endophyticum]